jgi:hypothetical protein
VKWLMVVVWWFAVIAPNGEITYFEYRHKKSCDIYEAVYKRIPSLTVTKCKEAGSAIG